MEDKRLPSQTVRGGIETNISRKEGSSKSKKDSTVAIVGAEWWQGQRKPGVDKGPDFLRKEGLVRSLMDLGHNVQDYGNIRTDPIKDDVTVNNVNLPKTCGEEFSKISKSVEKAVKSGATCLTLGGDHSVAIGTIHGHAQANKDLCVVWVDAHADINPPQASESGNMHGMPLAFLVKELAEYIPPVPGFEWCKPCLSAKNLAYIGLRDVDIAERFIIDTFGIPTYTILDVARYGIKECLDDALRKINPNMDKPIHLSFDIDGCDPVLAPSTGTPVPGGLNMREALYIPERLAATGKLRAFDLVEVNPELESEKDAQTTRQSALDVILAGFGKRGVTQMPSDYELRKP